jgi:4a-hydroxytetrahydrobiopterin dehydratase
MTKKSTTSKPAATSAPKPASRGVKQAPAATSTRVVSKSGAKLASKGCVPCEGGVLKLTSKQISKLLPQLDGWVVDGDSLRKSRTFFDFVDAMDFCNAMADIAEDEGHHPDFCVHFNRVDVKIWTHAIGGLSENDFILAAKIDRID